MGAPGKIVAAGGAAGRGAGRDGAGMLGTAPGPAWTGGAGREGAGGAS
jgi:hypothetical protein